MVGVPSIFKNVLLVRYCGSLWECDDEYNWGSLRVCDGIFQRAERWQSQQGPRRRLGKNCKGIC